MTRISFSEQVNKTLTSKIFDYVSSVSVALFCFESLKNSSREIRSVEEASKVYPPKDMPTAIVNSLRNQTHQSYAATSIDQINVPGDLQQRTETDQYPSVSTNM